MVISQWKRGRAIGRGSTATVFLAETSPSGQPFAVKSAELSRAALLRRENSILSTLRHPNIVSSLGFDVTAEGPARCRILYYNLFLEHVQGGSLADEVAKRGGRLDEPVIRRCARDLLRGLAYLHGKSITHCDVKPQNVLLGTDGGAKLADFGCARVAVTAAGEEREEENCHDFKMQFMGTPMFMAPEVATGEEQGTPADIWALGCTVVVMATGRQPWPDVADPAAALHRVAFSGDVPQCPSWISDEAKDFLDKCLRRDAGERWTAVRLLNHPFVAEQETNEVSFSYKEVDRVWVSPKSTLEQVFWDSTAATEEETISESGETAAERIRQLAGVYSPAIIWTRDDDDEDEDWITVRGLDDEQPTVVNYVEEQQQQQQEVNVDVEEVNQNRVTDNFLLYSSCFHGSELVNPNQYILHYCCKSNQTWAFFKTINQSCSKNLLKKLQPPWSLSA